MTGDLAEDVVRRVCAAVADIEPSDELAVAHRRAALRWLDSTQDIFRRVKPATPSPHLVAYFLLVDRPAGAVLLCDHRLSGLWLPTGGHVEPGEDPVDTVRREVVEELGIEATFDPVAGEAPFFLTVTETVGDPAARHTDVSLWFALAGSRGQVLHPDEREFRSVRWWRTSELYAAAPSRMEPHLLRALKPLQLDVSPGRG
ncbi:NUDIX hydrolase [Flexivirga sp. B27]